MDTLPRLSSRPVSHPGCCLSLSLPLLDAIASHLPRSPHFALSIGSGSGLLEKLLTTHSPKLKIQGVEVKATPCVNKYLPKEDMYTVSGSAGRGATCKRASAAAAWIFVYPRSPLLVRHYVEEHGSESVQTILWLGPKNDWSDFAGLLQCPVLEPPEEIRECGLPEYETMIVVRKKAWVM